MLVPGRAAPARARWKARTLANRSAGRLAVAVDTATLTAGATPARGSGCSCTIW